MMFHPLQLDLNMAIGINGRVLSALNEFKRLGSAYDRKRMDLLRGNYDAVIIGANTLRSDNPNMKIKQDNSLSESINKSRNDHPLVVTFSQSLNLPENLRFFQYSKNLPRLIFTHNPNIPEYMKPYTHRFTDQDGDLLFQGLNYLSSIGIKQVLCEGGPNLAQQLLLQNYLQEIYLTVYPVILNHEAPLLLKGLNKNFPLVLKDHFHRESELYLHYSLLKTK